MYTPSYSPLVIPLFPLPDSFFFTSLSILLEVSLSVPSPQVAQSCLLPLLPWCPLTAHPGLMTSWVTAETGWPQAKLLFCFVSLSWLFKLSELLFPNL